jgi:hypothetical protein
MNIKETDTTVIIDGIEIEGFIDEERFCPICRSNQVYFDDYDSYFCPECNYWIEKKCGDPHCDYCSNRPYKPLPFK